MSISSFGTIFAIVVGCAAFFTTSYTTNKQIKYQSNRDRLDYRNKIFDKQIQDMRMAFDNLYSSCLTSIAPAGTKKESEFYGNFAIALQYVPAGKVDTFYKLRDGYTDYQNKEISSQEFTEELYSCVTISKEQIKKIQEEQKLLTYTEHNRKKFLGVL